MRRMVFGLLVLAILAGLCPHSEGADISTEQVQREIDRAVAYLKREQSSDGTWRDWLGYQGGTTALCTLALLSAGENPEDPHIQKALNYLRKLKPAKTYVVALQTMVFCKAEPVRDLVLIQRNARWLERIQIQEGRGKG